MPSILDNLMKWLGPTVVIAIGIAVIFDLPIGHAMFCEPEKNCFVSWIGALSGWAALAGALATIGVMRDQLAEQRRQTDYISGDLPPEIYLDRNLRKKSDQAGDDYFSEFQVTVVNRNRRTLKLSRLEILAPEGVEFSVRSTQIADVETSNPFAVLFRGKQGYVHATLPGREDGQPAPKCTINCHLFTDGKLVEFDARHPESNRDQTIGIRLECIQKGANDKSIILDGSGDIVL